MTLASSSGYLTRLYKLLTAHFDLDELRTLCFDLSADYDTLRGEAKSTKALELISLMLREHRLNELVSTLRKERPSADWPTEAEQPSPDELLAWATPGTLNIADYLAALRDYCANLPYLTLHDIHPPKTLDEVYIPLKARPQPSKKDPQGLEDLEGLRERSEPLSISDVMRQREPPHILILGEPGAGKSTLLRQLAGHAWDAPGKIGLDASHLPILVPLRRLAAAEGALEERLNHALTAELALTQALPQGFFTNWPKQTGANWLILLDALDEVPADQRAQLMQWLKGLLSRIGQNRVVLTSRPSGYLRQGELDDKQFGHYDLLAFTPDQTGEFARKWFEDKAEQFLKELERVRAGALSGTPLLLTIAAKVYLEKGTLPERRSGLYEQFVDIWLAEAEQRGLRAELGDPVCDVAKLTLARLALAMTEQPTQTEVWLTQMVANYLPDAASLTRAQAETSGARFLSVMARRSGVFTRRGDAYDFIHQTLREYLAAFCLVRGSRHDLRWIGQNAVSRWVDRDWQEIVLFALSILSDAGVDVSYLLWQICQNGELGLCFAANALAEQVKVDTTLSNSIIDRLLAEAENEGIVCIAALGKLHGYEKARNSLLRLAQDQNVSGWVHLETARVLSGLGYVDQAAQTCLAVARRSDPWRRVHERAVLFLGQLGRTDELLSVALEQNAWAFVRTEAAEYLQQLGDNEKAARAWSALARDVKVDEPVHARAAEALGELAQMDDLIALAGDERSGAWTRKEAAEALYRLGLADKAKATLLALAHDGRVDKETRVRTAQALGGLGQANKAARILSALARDEKTQVEVRMHAAEALGQLGRASEAAQAWLALARDGRVVFWLRRYAAEAMGRLADASTLPALERIAQKDESQDVRHAAQLAIEQIRERMKHTHADTQTTPSRQD